MFTFRHAGLPASVSASYGRKSIEKLPWIVMISIPGVVVFFTAYGKAAGETLGKATGDGVRRLITDIYRRRSSKGKDGTVVLWDLETKGTYILQADLPSKAYAKLTQAKPDSRSVCKWDPNKEEWAPPF